MRNLHLIVCFFTGIVLLTTCGKNENVTPAETPSIVGKWTLQTLGATTNTKSYEVTPTEISTAAQTNAQIANLSLILSTATYEFKSDSTYSFGTDQGKWSLSKDKTKLILSSSNIGQQEWNIENLSATGVKVVGKKYLLDDGEAVNLSSFQELMLFSISILPVTIKGSEAEFNAATSMQGYTILKR